MRLARPIRLNRPARLARLARPAGLTVAVAFSAFAALTATPAAAQGCIAFEVHHVRPDQGVLMLAAYADAASFNKQPVTAAQMRAGSATTQTVQLCGIAGPSVAVMAFQDLNGNGKLDSNVFGIPSEPWGASGTPKAMSAPTWESAAVALDGKTVTVTLSR